MCQCSVSLDDVHVRNGDASIEVASNHLLTVAIHDTLTRGEVLRCKDRRSDDKRHVRSIDIASLKVASALVADEDLVPWEVRILIDREAVAKSTNILGTANHSTT